MERLRRVLAVSISLFLLLASPGPFANSAFASALRGKGRAPSTGFAAPGRIVPTAALSRAALRLGSPVLLAPAPQGGLLALPSQLARTGPSASPASAARVRGVAGVRASGVSPVLRAGTGKASALAPAVAPAGETGMPATSLEAARGLAAAAPRREGPGSSPESLRRSGEGFDTLLRRSDAGSSEEAPAPRASVSSPRRRASLLGRLGAVALLALLSGVPSAGVAGSVRAELPVPAAAGAVPAAAGAVPAAAAAAQAQAPQAPAPVPAPAPRATEQAPSGKVIFPEVQDGQAKEKSLVETWWEKWGLLILGPLFLAGLLLALTPCVLPLVPTTVAIVGGVQAGAKISRSRLMTRLGSYVLGLSTTFGAMGLAASLTGGSISAAFQNPIALGVIGGIYVLMGLGMLGFYEKGGSARLEALRQKLARKGGSVPAAFLMGALAAVIASPCTGPVIASLLLFSAQAGNALLGFLMFFTVGLGMGAVFFLAGSLNLAMRPGPWMVWVRRGFGVTLIAMALYYLASAGFLSTLALGVVGAGLAALVGWGTRRKMLKEYEPKPKARREGLILALITALAVVGVAWTTRPRAPSEGALSWTSVTSVEELRREVEEAKARGQAVVVDVWATWCKYCLKYDDVIENDPRLHAAFSKAKRLRLDVSEDNLDELREAMGIPNQQPYMVFMRDGKIYRSLDIKQWHGDEAGRVLGERVEKIGLSSK